MKNTQKKVLPGSVCIEIKALGEKKINILHATDMAKSKGSPLMSSADNNKSESRHHAKLLFTV